MWRWYKAQQRGHLNKQRFVPATLKAYRSFLLLLTLQTTESRDFLSNHLLSSIFFRSAAKAVSWRPGAWKVKEKPAILDRAPCLAQSNLEPSRWWDREPSRGVQKRSVRTKGFSLSLALLSISQWVALGSGDDQYSPSLLVPPSPAYSDRSNCPDSLKTSGGI